MADRDLLPFGVSLDLLQDIGQYAEAGYRPASFDALYALSKVDSFLLRLMKSGMLLSSQHLKVFRKPCIVSFEVIRL